MDPGAGFLIVGSTFVYIFAVLRGLMIWANCFFLLMMIAFIITLGEIM